MSAAFGGLEAMIAEAKERRAVDAERYAALGRYECQMCGATGEDKRTLRMRCLYAIHEVVPEAIQMKEVDDSDDYLLRVCKSCRGRFLDMLGKWRDACLAMRPVPKNHDGREVFPDDDERCIPVRENGRIVMLTRDEWDARATSPDSAVESPEATP